LIPFGITVNEFENYVSFKRVTRTVSNPNFPVRSNEYSFLVLRILIREPIDVKKEDEPLYLMYFSLFGCFTEKELSESKSESGDGELKSESRETPSRNSVVVGRKRERESSGEEHELSIDESQTVGNRTDGISILPVGGGNNSSSGPCPSALNKNMKTGKLYSCSYCSYSADKKVSLNRHMRMHSGGPPSLPNQNENGNVNGDSAPSSSTLVSPFPTAPGRTPAEGITAADRYCFDCEIQFTSLKTFKVHKQYYCSTRHVMKAQGVGGPAPGLKVAGPDVPLNPSATSPHGSITPGLKQAASPVTREGSPIPIGSPIPSQPFVVLPTNPVIIVPYCFIQGASLVPGNLLPSQNALIILPNGNIQSLPGTSLPLPMPMSFPSPTHQLGGSSLVMGPYGHPAMSPTSTTNPTNLSPPGHHSVFNDPKDVIRRICGGTRNSSASGETISSESHPSRSHSHSHRSHRSSLSEKETESVAEMEVSEPNGEESIPAIDLTLRNFIKKETMEGEDEKENHDVAHPGMIGIQMPPFPPQLCIGTSQQSRNDGITQSDVELRHELSANSPSRQSLASSGSTHSGRRTPRPPSISSSCSSSPAPNHASEHKLNGLKFSRTSAGRNSHSYTPSPHGESYPNGSRQIVKSKVDHHHGILGSKLRIGGGTEKMSPITTQLPGGAILTTASNQSLAELLMSNPPELTESLATLNSHLHSMNSGGSPGMQPQFDPAAMMAAAASLPPDLAMTYLANIQHSIQQQHNHQIQVVKHQQQQQATIKRGVWKCVDCEIVFYKQENFLVHKEQYCASRSNGNSIEGKGIPTKENNRLRGFKSKERQISKLEATVSRSSSSAGETSLSPPPQPSSSGLVSSSGEMNNPLSSIGLRTSPSVVVPTERKAQVEAESQFRIKSERPVPVTPSPPALGSPARNTPNHIKAESPPSSTQSISPSQYLCHKCGVKYSSLDNLTTHQTFYCNKRPSVTSLSQEPTNGLSLANHHSPAFPQQKSSPPISSIDKLLGPGAGERGGFTRCGRCNLCIPEDHMNLHSPVCHGQSNGIGTTSQGTGLPSSSSTTAGWKCPCCDTYSPTMSAAQKHLETHTGIRAFKCVICGYRGNTLRGMRTHIRVHFDKRFSDLQEGDYISCITATDLELSGQPQSAPTALTAGATGSVNGALTVRIIK